MGVSQDAPCAASCWASSPPARCVPARGVEVPLDARPVRASPLLSPRLVRRLKIQERLSRCGHLFPAPLIPRLVLPTHHCMLCEVISRGCLRRTSPILDPPVLYGLLAEEHGRIVDPALTSCGFRTTAGLVGVALAGTSLGLLTAAGPGASVRFPLFARGIVMGLVPSFFPLTARDHGQEAGEPGVSCESVLRLLLSPRPPLSLRRRQQWLLL